MVQQNRFGLVLKASPDTCPNCGARSKPLPFCVHCKWEPGEEFFLPPGMLERDRKEWEMCVKTGWPLTKKERAELAAKS